MWNARGRAEFRFELKGGQKYCFLGGKKYKQKGNKSWCAVRNKTFQDLKGGGEGSRANFPRAPPPLLPPPPLNAALLEVDNIATCTSFMWNKVVKYTCKYMYI